MQAENVKNFTGRLDAIQRRWNCSDIELAKRLGISRQLIYLMRSGAQKPSKKSIRLLEVAEAGLQPLDAAPPSTSNVWKPPSKNLPTSGKSTPAGVQRLDESTPEVPTPGNPPPDWFQRLETRLDDIAARLDKLEAKKRRKR